MDKRNPNGTFKPGHGGIKRRGDVGEVQRTIKNALGEFVIGKLPDLNSIFDSTPAKDRGKLLLEMIAYLMPKMREIHQTNEDVTPRASFDYTKLSAIALKEVLSLTTIENGPDEN